MSVTTATSADDGCLASEHHESEYHASELVKHNFGAAFEVYELVESGFVRVNDIMHLYATIVVEKSGQFQMGIDDAMMRQWYQDECLYIFSAPSMEGYKEGLAPVAVTAPGVLSERCPDFRLLSRWPPNILCIHHNFHFAGMGLGQVSVSYGSTGYFDFVQEGIGFRWTPTQKYLDMLQEVATWIATTQWPN